MPKLTKIVKSYANCALRIPTAAGILECGHYCTLRMLPLNEYACFKCRAPAADYTKSCACGCFSYNVTVQRSAHDAILSEVGDEFACDACERIANGIATIHALHNDVFRARFREWCGVGQYHFYRRDEGSPSGVLHLFTVEACAAVDEVLRQYRISPLSPTER